MSDHHHAGPLDEDAAERLLDGADGHPRLHALLSAAAAPARPDELAGEDAAVAAFRAAPRTAHGSRAATLRRLLPVKILVAIGGSLILTGGAAYATMTGRLPGRAPAPATSPTVHHTNDDRDGDHHSDGPPTRLAPPPSSTPSPTSRRPETTSPGKSEQEHGKKNAPGQLKEDGQPAHPGGKPPGLGPTPPRGSENPKTRPTGDQDGTEPVQVTPTEGDQGIQPTEDD